MIKISEIQGAVDDEDQTRPERISPLDNLNFFSNDIQWDVIMNEFNDVDWKTLYYY